MTTAITVNHRDLILAGPVGSLDAYVQAVNVIPVLSREDEQELARQFRENDDLDAARRLVMSQLRFVVHIARGYGGYGLPLNDLVQEGNIGLMKAVKRFDPEVGVRLVSFAVHWIRAEIHEYVLKNWRLKFLGWLSQTETEAIANDLGVSAREVTEMEKRLSGQDMAFDPAPSDDEERAYAPAHYLTSNTPDPAELIEADDWQEQANGQLHSALQNLDERSREILQARWLAEKKTTLQVLAKRYGVSAERIRQIEQHAIKALRAELTEQ